MVNKELIPVAMDTENNSDGTLGAWSFAFRDNHGTLCVYPNVGSTDQLILQRLFDKSIVAFHNYKWDARVLHSANMPIPENSVDTMIAAYCVHPNTKILTRDLYWVRAGQLKVGDELIGVDEHTVGKRRRTMLPTKVTHISRRTASCSRVTFSNGKTVIATNDHPWLTNMSRHKADWKQTNDLRPGWRMLCPLTTWETDTSYEGGYLAGILDGEGSWSKHNLQIAQKPGIVLSYVERLLHSYKVPYSRYLRSDGCVKLSISCTSNALPLLGSVRAERLIAKEKWIGVSPTRRTDPNVFVTSVEPIGDQEVVTLETAIHTYNAEGFWVHNCLGHGRQETKDSSKSSSGDSMVGGLGLKYLARRHLGMKMKTWEEVKDHPELIPEYNANDSVATYLLFEKWKPELPQHFWDIDTPLLRVLMKMEDVGIEVDSEFLKKYAESLDKQLANIDVPINPFSPPEIISYVYGTLGIEPERFTDSGQPSTDAETLEMVDDPIVKRILEYREFHKERKTYVSSYSSRLDVEHRIHCEFKQTSTATGRLSSARPNLQNVTKGTDLRKLFIAKEGHTLVRADFKHLDLRAFVAITQEPSMLKAFQENRDIHQETADILGVSRDTAKNINFLILFGGTAWRMSQEYKIPINKAQDMIDQYFSAFPGIKKYMDEQIERAKTERKVYSYYGRMRRLDGMFSQKWKTRKDAENQAINTPVQSLEADIVKRAMIELHYKHQAPMVLQVHDELLFEVPKNEAEEYAHWLKEYIPTITEINGLTFPVDVSSGDTWHECCHKEVLDIID